mmetsp:Transcript_3899/g.4034  ORF Transcript_3899/g.4034 Transcript_3899/m.4034 type:complete len:868 (+) Transcript_3899:3-2606(+)
MLEAAHVMRLCLKIFWSATIYTLPTVQGIDVNSWFQIIGHILQKNLPEASEGQEPAGQPLDLEARKVWPWWKLKKWAAKIISHFIQRYGNPRYAGSDVEVFANYFKSHIASGLLGPVMNSLALKANGVYVSEDVHRFSLAYVASCVEMSVTYKVLKPHMDFILFSVIFPTLCLSLEDISLFSSDPVEFVRKIHDPSEDWLDPRIAAVNLLQMLARYRQKDTLPRLLPFIEGVLLEYNNTSVESRNYQKKDGILVAIATIFKILNESKIHKGMLEPLIITHVIPEFKSPVAYIRSRACWVIEYVSECEWKNPQTLPAVLQGLLGGLKDPSLPVQAAAACSLRTLISLEGATDLLRPYLSEIINEYFRIMDEVENDAVLSALQAIVEQFGVEIKDYAVVMTGHLLRAFTQYSNAGNDDDEAAFAASQCLDTIGTVLDVLQEEQDVMGQLENLIIPFLFSIISNGEGCYEYLDNAIQMMSYFTYYNTTISPVVWQLCGPFLKVLNEWGSDYLCEIMVPILNYISKDISTFLVSTYEGVPLVTMLLIVVEKQFLEDTSDTERDAKAAATMLTCLLSCAKDNSVSIVGILPKILSLILNRVSVCRTTSLRIRVLECGMSAIYYSPEATVSHLITDSNTKTFFNTLFSTFNVMENDTTQRLIVLSMSALLSLNSNALPEDIKVNVQNIFQQIIRELVFIEEQKIKDDNAEEGDGSDGDDDDDMEDREGEEEDDDSDDNDDLESDDDAEDKEVTVKKNAKLDVPDGGYNEDEDCINAEDEEYRAVLERMDGDQVKHIKFVDGEPVDDEEDDNEDYIYTSPIDILDVSSYFLNIMSAASIREPQLINSLQIGLNDEDKVRLKEIVSKVEERRSQV